MAAVLRCAVLASVALTTGCAKEVAQYPLADGFAPLLWQDPARRLPNSAGPPRPPFTFVKEDQGGASPKFTVVDAEGMRWEAKFGPEAHTEVAAGHILTSVGYFVEEMYFLPSIRVDGLNIRRGLEFVTAHETVRDVRLEARGDDVERGETWDWADNPFVGTQTLDGLRVLMVLINNYDARTANNRVLRVENGGRTEIRYVVADIGASFGRYGGMGGSRSRNDLDGYRASRFIERIDERHVHFAYRTQPEGWGRTLFVLNPFYTAGELKKQRDMRLVPIASARWIGRRLVALGDRRIAAAFERAGYRPSEVAGFARVLQERIRQLASL